MDKRDLQKRIYTFFAACIIVLIETAIVGVAWVYFYNKQLPKEYYFWGNVFILAIYLVILFFFSGMYGGLKIGSFRMLELLFSQVFATACADILFYAIACMLAYHFPSPLPYVLALGVQCICIGLWIMGATYIYRSLFPPLDILLIHAGDHTERFVNKVKTRKHQFHISEEIRIDAALEELYAAIERHEAVMMWDIPTPLRNKLFKYCYEMSVDVYVMPKISDIILNGSQTLHLFDTPLLLTKSTPMEPEQIMIKRLFDILFALVILIVTSPIMLITAIAIKLYDRGPVLYKQVRCTIGGKEFKMYKFRSMIEAAEKDGVARLATQNDNRITPVGKVIRKVRIDELPQLFNVINGTMSFVGPRPERPEIIEKYRKVMPEFVYRMKVKAGLTGYAQIYGKYNSLPYDKLKLDLYYIEHFSVWLDLKLIILTLKILLTLDSTEGIAEGDLTPLGRGSDEDERD